MFRPQIVIGILLGALLMVVVASRFGFGESKPSNPRRLVTHASEPIGSLFDAPASGAAAPPAPKATPAPSAGRAAAPPAPATPAADTAPRLAPAATASPIPPAVTLSTDHARLLMPPSNREPVTVPEMHAQYAAEPRDASWSHEMEQTLRRYFADSRIEPGFELLSVDCRTTLCEILAFGNTPDAQQRWNAIGATMQQQPWWSNFRGNATSSSDRNGRVVIATILQRKKP